MDEFATASHRRAAAATEAGLFRPEVAPVTVTRDDGTSVVVDRDEGIRPSTTPEVLAGLRPAYYDEGYAARFPEIAWNVTAGNASQVNDGSAALLITTSEKAAELGLTPKARLHSFAVVGDDPIMMLTGVIPATDKVLRRAGLSLDDIDLFEVNEAFASVVLAWQTRDRRRPGQGQRGRRGHRPRPPARRQRRPHHDHAGPRHGAQRRPLRPPDHVRGRRPGQRHRARAPLSLTWPPPGARLLACRAICR